MEQEKKISLKIFITTIIILCVILIATITGMIFYYENKIEQLQKEKDDIKLVQNGMPEGFENVTVVE